MSRAEGRGTWLAQDPLARLWRRSSWIEVMRREEGAGGREPVTHSTEVNGARFGALEWDMRHSGRFRGGTEKLGSGRWGGAGASSWVPFEK